MKSKPTLRSFLLIAGSSLFAISSSHAQSTYTWANSNVTGTPATPLDWFTGGPNTQGTWTGGDPVSSNLNTIRFFQDNTTALLNTAAPSVQTVNLNNGGSAFQLDTLFLSGRASATASANLTMTLSGDALHFSGATGTVNLQGVDNSRTLTYNVNHAIQLGTASTTTALTFLGGGSGTFKFGGAISELSAGSSILKSGTSAAVITGPVSITGGVSASGGSIGLGSNANSFTGGITLSGGAGLSNDVDSIAAFSNDARMYNGNKITVTSGNSTVRGFINSSGFTTHTGGIQIDSGATLTTQIASAAWSFNCSGVLEGSGTLVGGGASTTGVTINLTNTGNTFTGTLTNPSTNGVKGFNVASLGDGGKISMLSASEFALNSTTAAPVVFNTRVVELGNTGTNLVANNASSASNTLTINTGVTYSGTGNRALTLGGSNTGVNAVSSNITNNIGKTLLTTAFAIGATDIILQTVDGISIGASISGTGIDPGTTITAIDTGTKTVTLSTPTTGAGALNQVMTVDGVFYPVSLSKTGAGTWALGGTNTYNGATNLLASGTTGKLVIQGAQAMSPNTSFVFAQNSSNVQSIRLLDDGAGTINMARPFSFSGTNTTQQWTFFVGNNHTDNLGSNASSSTTGSTIQIGAVSIGSIASDTASTSFNATGANGYRLQTGAFTLSNANGRTAGSNYTTFFNPTTAPLTVASVTMADGNALKGVPILQLGGTASGNEITGAISDASDALTTGRPLNLTKQNTSVWTLSGTNTYTGTTTVAGGTLLVNGSLHASSAVSVNGGTLGGNGTINGSVTVNAAGNVAPGTSVGILNIGGNLNISGMAGGAGLLNYELGANTATSDRIAVTGTLTLGTGSLGFTDFAFTNAGGLQNGTYTLITATGGINGGDSLDGADLSGSIGVGGTGTLQITGNSIELVVSGLGGGATYSDWASLNGAGTNLSDDHDNDDVDNGTEYFIGGPSGNTTGFTALPGVVNSSGILSVTWNKASDYTGTYGTDYVVETSDTLVGAWVPEIASPNPGFTVTFPTATTVKYTFPNPLGTKKFVRLKVTGP